MSTLPYNPDAYNTPDVEVSPLSVRAYFPALKAPIGTWAELWFGSSSHLDVGYKSNDPDVVAKQVANIKALGFDFVILNSYGFNVEPQNSASLLWVPECEKQGLKFCVGLDKGTFHFGVPAGTDLTTYGLKQMQFIAQNFFPSPAYMRHSDGRFLFLNWDCASVSGLDCGKVFSSIPNVAVLYVNAGGVSQPSSSGSFPWVGLPDPAAYQASYLAAVQKSKAANPKEILFASLVKGFDDHGRRSGLDPTKSCWNQTQPYRFVGEQQGQFFLDRVAALNAFQQAHPGVIDYIFTPTLNDYEEDTCIERGIDSQGTVSLAASQGVLTLTLTGNLNAVDHVDLSVNGLVVRLDPARTLTVDLNSRFLAGVQTFACSAVAVGKPLIQNKASNTVTVTAVVVPAQTVAVEVPVHIDTSVDVPVSGSVNGLSVQGTVSVPVKQDSMMTVTATVTTQTIWS